MLVSEPSFPSLFLKSFSFSSTLHILLIFYKLTERVVAIGTSFMSIMATSPMKLLLYLPSKILVTLLLLLTSALRIIEGVFVTPSIPVRRPPLILVIMLTSLVTLILFFLFVAGVLTSILMIAETIEVAVCLLLSM